MPGSTGLHVPATERSVASRADTAVSIGSPNEGHYAAGYPRLTVGASDSHGFQGNGTWRDVSMRTRTQLLQVNYAFTNDARELLQDLDDRYAAAQQQVRRLPLELSQHLSASESLKEQVMMALEGIIRVSEFCGRVLGPRDSFAMATTLLTEICSHLNLWRFCTRRSTPSSLGLGRMRTSLV